MKFLNKALCIITLLAMGSISARILKKNYPTPSVSGPEESIVLPPYTPGEPLPDEEATTTLPPFPASDSKPMKKGTPPAPTRKTPTLPKAEEIGATESYWNLSSVKIKDEKIKEMIADRLERGQSDAAIIEGISNTLMTSNGALRLVVIKGKTDAEVRNKIAGQVRITLPKVKQEQKYAKTHGGLMEEIRQGVKLRPVNRD